MRARACAALLFAAAVGVGCPRRPTPPGVRPVHIPSGCHADLSGTYAFEGREEWQYAASDDGGTLVLRPLWTSPDAGAAAERQAGTEIILERTPDGFVGATRAVAWPAQGVACPVSFPTEVKACGEEGLLLRTVDAVRVDESCRPAQDASPPMREVELRRAGAPASAPDAGR